MSLEKIAIAAKNFLQACHEPDDGADFYSQWQEGDLFLYNELLEALNEHYGLDLELSSYAAGNLERYHKWKAP